MVSTHARESEDFRDLRDHLDFIEANASWAWDWNITNLTGGPEWFKYPHAKIKQDNHHDVPVSRVREGATIESKIEEHEDEITQLKAQINGNYHNKERLKTMVGAWRKACENLKMQIRDLSANSKMTSHEENLTFMFHRIHGMFKEYESRPDRIGSLICRLLVDLENARTKLKKLVNISKRSKKRSEAIYDAVRNLESPSEELRRHCSIAKVTISHYLSRRGSRTYLLNPEEREAERKYGWDLAIQPYFRAVDAYEAKFGEMNSAADLRYTSDEDAGSDTEEDVEEGGVA